MRPKINHFRIHKKCYFPVKFVVSLIIFVNDCIYIVSILTSDTNSGNGHSKHSKEFPEFIGNESVADEIMVSFDVTSLYTKAPIKDTYIIIKVILANYPDLQTNIPDDLLFITILLLIKTCVYFNVKFLNQVIFSNS